MGAALKLLRDRKTATSLLVLLLILILLPVGLFLIKNRQIFQPRAAGELIQLGDGGCIRVNKKKEKAVDCSLVPLKLTNPFFKVNAVSPSSSSRSSASPAASGSPGPGNSASPSPSPSPSAAGTPQNVNVKSFDNNIQAALDSIKQSGGSVYLPAGTYNPPDKIRIYSNVTLFGDGMNKTVINHVKKSDPLISNDSSRGQQNITIRDLALKSDGQESQDRCCSGIQLANLDGGFITHVKVEKFGYSGILFSYKVKENQAQAVRNVRVSNCYLTGNLGPGINLFMGDNNVIDNCTLLNNSLKSGAGVNIELGAEGSALNNYISQNTITQNGPAALLSAPGAGMSVASNKVCYNKEDTKSGIIDYGGSNNIYIGNITNTACVENDGKVDTDSKSSGVVEKLPPATDTRCNIPDKYAVPQRPSGPGIFSPPDNQIPSPDKGVQASCQTQDNIFGNCGFENPINEVTKFQCVNIWGNWVNTGQYKPGIMRADTVSFSRDAKSGNRSLAIGSLNKSICTDPKTFHGDHTRGSYSLFSEVFQPFNLKGKNSLTIDFWYKVKSEGSSGKAAAPFFVYITTLANPVRDAWIYQIWPNENKSCGNGQTQVGEIPGEWKHQVINLSSSKLSNIGVAGQIGYVSFGVMNNYPTLVLLDDVKVTTSSSSASNGLFSNLKDVLVSKISAQENTGSDKLRYRLAESEAGLQQAAWVEVALLPGQDFFADYRQPLNLAKMFNGLSDKVTPEALAKDSNDVFIGPEFINTNFQLASPQIGAKQIWVEFLHPDGTSKVGNVNFNLVEKLPQILGLSCNLDIAKENLKINITGDRFGTGIGTVESVTPAAKPEVLGWNDKEINAFLKKPNIPVNEGQRFKIKLTRADGFESGIVTCTVDKSLISLGARIFCREPGKFDQSNVIVNLIYDPADPANPNKLSKVEEKVTINADGEITNLKTKLQVGKNYTIAVKVPSSLRRSATFTAQEGTTEILGKDGGPFILPIGDIAPPISPDGRINTVDRSELIRQWRILGQARNKLTGDFNLDTRVNSIDWACMNYDFGKEDDPIPTSLPQNASGSIHIPGGEETIIIPSSASPAPTGSISPEPSPSKDTSNSAKIDIGGRLFLDTNRNRIADIGESFISQGLAVVKLLQVPEDHLVGTSLTADELGDSRILAQATNNLPGANYDVSVFVDKDSGTKFSLLATANSGQLEGIVDFALGPPLTNSSLVINIPVSSPTQ